MSPAPRDLFIYTRACARIAFHISLLTPMTVQGDSEKLRYIFHSNVSVVIHMYPDLLQIL